jgi:hypothetical protein
VKSFYEMIQILREFYGPDDDPNAHYFYSPLGEEGDEPFAIEVEINGDGDWKPYNNSSLGVKKDGASGDKKEDWTFFDNPGRRLERVPEPIRSRALAWIGAQAKWLADNHEPDDPPNHKDRHERKWDDEDQAAYDRRTHGFDREDR